MGYIKIILSSLFLALLITIILELLAIIIQKIKNRKIYYLCIVVNLLTNPLMNILLNTIFYKYYYLALIILEIIVIIIESFVYNLVIKNYKVAFRIALINNIISWFGSYLIYYFY